MTVYTCGLLHTYLRMSAYKHSLCKCDPLWIICMICICIKPPAPQVYGNDCVCVCVWPCVLSRMYRAEKLPNTNLVFLITDAKATCLSCDPRPLRQAEQPCILSLNPRKKKKKDLKKKRTYPSFLLSGPPSITLMTAGL